MTEDVKHVESSLRELIEQIMTADSRGVANPVASERFIRDHGRKLLAVLQREAAGDGEGGGISSIIHEVGQAIFLLPSGAGSVRDRLDTAMGLLRELSAAPRPTGTEDGEGWRTCRCGVGSIHYQKDCTTPASAEPGEAVAYRWVHPDGDSGEWTDMVHLTSEYRLGRESEGCRFEFAHPDARGGGEAVARLTRFVDGSGMDASSIGMEPAAYRLPHGVYHLYPYPAPAALDAESGKRVYKVAAQGVWFSPNVFFSHEQITGRTAEELNARTGVIIKNYMEWVDAARATTGANGNG